MRKNLFPVNDQFYFGIHSVSSFESLLSAFRADLCGQQAAKGKIKFFVFVSKNVADQKIKTIPCMTTRKNKTFSTMFLFFQW
jgi:hypothetical protein